MGRVRFLGFVLLVGGGGGGGWGMDGWMDDVGRLGRRGGGERAGEGER